MQIIWNSVPDGVPLSECSLIKQLISDFTKINYWWLGVVVFAFFISNVMRALRWHLLLEPLGSKPRFVNSFFSTMIGYFVNLGFPRAGEFARAGIFSRYEKVSFEQAVGTIVIGRAIDVFCLLIFILLTLIFEYQSLYKLLSENVNISNFNVNYAAGLFVILLIIVAGIYTSRKWLSRFSIVEKIKKSFQGLKEGLVSIKKLDQKFTFILYSVGIWVMYFLMTYLSFFAFEPTSHLGLGAGLLVFVFGAFGIVIPSPGGMGTYHYLVILSLSTYGILGSNAFSYANIIFFTISILSNVIFGIIGIILLPIVNNEGNKTKNLQSS
jgi:uncharacterized protein (TIRG00374 family)